MTNWQTTLTQEFDITTIHRLDIESFRPFFEKYTLILRRFAVKYLPDEDFAQDVVQETMIRFWERRHKFSDMSAVVSFLFVTTKNAIFDEMRHRKVVSQYATRYVLGGANPLYDSLKYRDEDAVRELYNALEWEVAQLPRRTQEIIRLKLAGFQMMEIAEILDIGRETVKTLQRSGMAKLAKTLEPWTEFYYSHQEELSM